MGRRHDLPRWVGLLTGAVLLLASAPAEAQRTSEQCRWARSSMLWAGITDAPTFFVFGIADITYAAQGGWMPPGWAGTEIVVGGGLNFATGLSIVGLFGGSTEPNDPYETGCTPEVAAFTATTLSLGALFTAHGILSLALYEPPAEAGTDGEAAQTARLVPVVTASPTGGSLTWRW